jgi:hypothetical protein
MGVHSHMQPIDLSAMDLFHFTMQQLAPIPVGTKEGDAYTLPSYLRHWLHRHRDASKQHALPPLESELGLDAAGKAKLAHDLESFYGVPVSAMALATLHTLPEVEAHLKQHLAAGAR